MANSRYSLVLVLLVSAIFGLALSGNFVPLPHVPRARTGPSSGAAPVSRSAVLTVITQECHPSFRPIQLNQGKTCVLKIGALESEARRVLGQPLKSVGNERIYQFKAVQYDWERDKPRGSSHLIVKIGRDGDVEGLTPIPDDYAQFLMGAANAPKQ